MITINSGHNMHLTVNTYYLCQYNVLKYGIDFIYCSNDTYDIYSVQKIMTEKLFERRQYRRHDECI
jgi:hypothetical protein